MKFNKINVQPELDKKFYLIRSTNNYNQPRNNCIFRREILEVMFSMLHKQNSTQKIKTLLLNNKK